MSDYWWGQRAADAQWAAAQAREISTPPQSAGPSVCQQPSTDVWVTPPPNLLTTAAEYLLEIDKTDDRDVPRKLVEGLLEYFSEDTECDHAVNICVCNYAAISYELRLLLDGKKVCGDCHGDGFYYDQETYNRNAAPIVAAGYDADEQYGYLPCRNCEGKGEVAI